MSPLVGGLIALLVTTALTPVAIRIARRAGIVDRPGALKVQEVPVAYLGGVAVLAGLLAGLLGRVGTGPLLVPLVLATLLGLADDLLDLDARLRLACEVAIGVVAAFLVPAGPGVLGHVVTAAAVVGLLNAVNLLDGLDGLAGGVGAVAALGFALVGPGPRPLALALAGALAGFLVFNRPPARIYLGDAGAYLVGTALALLCATSLDATPSAATWAGLPLLVAIPVTDTAVAIVRRRLAGRPLFAGDRSHLYDQLVDRGASRTAAVGRMVAAQVVLTSLGVAAVHLPGPLAWTVLLVSAGILAVLVVGRGFLTPDGPSPEGLHP
ncbi:MAG: glycosyltransferase family 4 protein [Actinomycetes bacterium]